MASNLEVFLISSYYQRRRGATAGVRISPTGIIRQYRLNLDSQTSAVCHWMLNGRIDLLKSEPDAVIYRRRVATSTDEKLSFVLEGHPQEDTFLYKVEVWTLDRVTGVQEKLHATRTVEFGTDIRLFQSAGLGDFKDYVAPRNPRLSEEDKLTFFDSCKTTFRLESKDELIYFSDIRGSGLNTCRMMQPCPQKFGNYGFHLVENSDQIYLQMVASKFYMFKSDKFVRKKVPYSAQELILALTDFQYTFSEQKDSVRMNRDARLKMWREFILPCLLKLGPVKYSDPKSPSYICGDALQHTAGLHQVGQLIESSLKALNTSKLEELKQMDQI